MTIRYKCEECGVAMKIKDDLAGKKGKCPQCKSSFIVPSPEEPVEEADELPLDDPQPEEEDWDDEDDDDLLDMPLEVVFEKATDDITLPKFRPAKS